MNYITLDDLTASTQKIQVPVPSYWAKPHTDINCDEMVAVLQPDLAMVIFTLKKYSSVRITESVRGELTPISRGEFVPITEQDFNLAYQRHLAIVRAACKTTKQDNG